MKQRVSIGVGAIVLLVASLVWARPGIVKTRQGQTIEGEITEKPDMVEVAVRGIEVQIQRDDIESLTYSVDVDEQYKQRLEQLDAADVAGRLALARWAFNVHRYDLARDAADKALQINENSREAVDFLQLIRQQQQLELSSKAGQTAPGDSTGDGSDQAGDDTAQPSTPATETEKRFLTADDINAIKQGELKADDTQIRVSFRNDVVRRYIQNFDVNARDFNAQTPVAKALEILTHAPASYHKDVVILGDPRPLLDFRRQVEPMVLQNCATSQCHTSGNATGFALFNERSEAASYTNFFILQKYTQGANEPAGLFDGAAARKMIDRNQPETSLLLTYGLPADAAGVAHPKVNGWRPMFRGVNDPRYQRTLEWIQSLRPIETSYGINYELPKRPTTGDAAPTTGPSTQPAQ